MDRQELVKRAKEEASVDIGREVSSANELDYVIYNNYDIEALAENDEISYSDTFYYSFRPESNAVFQRFYVKFVVKQFPGNCGIAVIHNLTRDIELDNIPLIKLCIEYAENIAEALGFTVVMFSDLVIKESLKTALLDSGYSIAFNFRNRRTTNHLNVYYKNIRE